MGMHLTKLMRHASRPRWTYMGRPWRIVSVMPTAKLCRWFCKSHNPSNKLLEP